MAPWPDTLPCIDEHAPDSSLDQDELRPRRSAGGALLAGFAFVLLFLVVQTIGFVLLDVAGAPLPSAGEVDTAELLALGFVQLAGIAAVCLLVLAGVAPWRRLGIGTGSFSRGWLALTPVGLLVIAPPLAGALASGDPLIDPDVSWVMALAIVGLALAIGVNEELWFRGIVVDQLSAARAPWLTVLASAALFGLPHAFGGSAYLLNAAAVTLAVGIPFTVVRLRAGGLGPLIAWHAVIDAWAFAHTASVTPQGSPSLVESAVTLVVPTLVALGYLLWFARGLPASRY